MEGGEGPYVSPGAGTVLHNPEDRKGLTLDFDNLKHPLFGSVDRGFKLWYTFNFELWLCFETNYILRNALHKKTDKLI